MAKSKNPAEAQMMKTEEEYRLRDDVDKLMRADEVCQDPKRYRQAVSRLTGTVKRLTGKKYGRSSGRSRSR